MKSQTAPAGNRELKVTVEMDQATVDSALQTVATSLAGRINIPGFRKSKVPYRVLERYVGRPALMAEAHEGLAQQALRFFLDEAGITEPEHVQLEKVTDEPTSYAFAVSLEPYVELLAEYRDLRIEPRVLELTAQEKEEEKAALCDGLAQMEETDSAIAWDDTVVLDIKGVVLDENLEPTDEVVLEDEEWEVEISEEHPLGPPNLEQEILGLKAGDAKEFVLTYPEESESVYAGKSARFAIRAVKVSRSAPAPWNAETIASALGLEVEGEARTLAEYEEILWERLSQRKAGEVFDEELTESLELLANTAVVEYADASVENQIDLLVNQRLSGLAQFGIRDLETYLRYTNQTEEEFRESLREQAETELVHKLLIWEFIRLEDIQIPEDEQQRVDAEAASSAQEIIESKTVKLDEGMTAENLAEFLSQQRMTANLRSLGHNALVELFTDGAHSPSTFFAVEEEVEAVEDESAEPPNQAEAVNETAPVPVEATSQAS